MFRPETANPGHPVSTAQRAGREAGGCQEPEGPAITTSMPRVAPAERALSAATAAREATAGTEPVAKTGRPASSQARLGERRRLGRRLQAPAFRGVPMGGGRPERNERRGGPAWRRAGTNTTALALATRGAAASTASTVRPATAAAAAVRRRPDRLFVLDGTGNAGGGGGGEGGRGGAGGRAGGGSFGVWLYASVLVAEKSIINAGERRAPAVAAATEGRAETAAPAVPVPTVLRRRARFRRELAAVVAPAARAAAAAAAAAGRASGTQAAAPRPG